MSGAFSPSLEILNSQRRHDERRGLALVAASAVVWSFGGTLARFLTVTDDWAVVFLRSAWAAAFLLVFLLLRDGPRQTLRLFGTMGSPGIAVAVCFSAASCAFILALKYTTVANILLIQASTPLIAALIGRVLFQEKVASATWVAIAAVVVGVGVMVSGSLTGRVSPVGDALAVLIALVLAVATVITRRASGVRMTPACCLSCFFSMALATLLAGSLSVSAADMGVLFAFGALNLGLGLALFATGVRLLPAPVAALIGTLEPVLGPVWVWLVHSEVPSARTLLGGSLVILALVSHIVWQWFSQARGIG